MATNLVQIENDSEIKQRLKQSAPGCGKLPDSINPPTSTGRWNERSPLRNATR